MQHFAEPGFVTLTHRTDDATEPKSPRFVLGLPQMDMVQRCVYARLNHNAVYNYSKPYMMVTC